MSQKRFFQLVPGLIVGLLMSLPALTLAEESLAAKVGNIPITVFELQREQQKILPFNVNFHGGLSQEKLDQIREEALSILIDRAYKVNYAIAEEIAVDNSAVEAKLEDFRQNFKTEKEFKTAAGDEGVARFRASLYRELLAKKAEEVAVEKRIAVTDNEVKAYYETNKASYMRPKQFKASHILIRVDPSSNKEEREALEKKAKDLLARAKAGEDFYDLAYYNSDDRSKFVGGDLGNFHAGQTVAEFDEAIQKLKAGEISDLVKTMYGYHIIQMVEVNEPKQLSFDEVQGKIRQQLEKAQRDSLFQAWMDALKEKYPVTKSIP